MKSKNLSDVNSIPQSSSTDSLSMKSNFFGPRAKKKKLVRRAEYTKTAFFLNQKVNINDNKPEIVQPSKTPIFSNFLRKKNKNEGKLSIN